MRKELRLWSLFSFTFYAQCFPDAAVGAMNTLKAVSIATSAIYRYLVVVAVFLFVVVVCFFLFFFGGGGGGDYPA